MAALLAIYISVAGLYALDIVKKIPASRKYSVNSHRYRFGTPTLISRKSLSFAVSSTRRDNSDEHQGEEGLDDGKFLKLGTEIVEPFGPLGLVIAGFNKEEYLDLIIDAFDKALPIGTPLPVAILGKSDIKKTFREVLSELQQRDCLLPADGEQLSLLAEHKQHHGNSCDSSQICYLRYPLVLCSGFQVLQLQDALRSIESIADRLPTKPMMAMAVPNAMDKKISQLLEEIEGDHDSRLGNSRL